MVESYVARNVGPVALLRDLALTARVMARFGPRLPRMVEAALIRQAEVPQAAEPSRFWPRAALIAAIGVVFALGLIVGRVL